MNVTVSDFDYKLDVNSAEEFSFFLFAFFLENEILSCLVFVFVFFFPSLFPSISGFIDNAEKVPSTIFFNEISIPVLTEYNYYNNQPL